MGYYFLDRKLTGTTWTFQRFEAAAEAVKGLTKRPTDQELLELYALFKQATVGDVQGGEYTLFLTIEIQSMNIR